MRCPSCDRDNREGRRFCAACGASLATPCPKCGFENEPGEDYCGGCGAAVNSATPTGPKKPAADDTTSAHESETTAAERRQLTVMFCDLVGSTEMASRLDPEDLQGVITACQRAWRDEIERYEGFVARYMGDGVLAYFGYPQAHEDDVERAVRTGLALVEATKVLNQKVGRESDIALAVRVGIATGQVVVGDFIGEGASQESAVVGETPNLAARLQVLAEPNAVVVALSTHQLAGGLFDYKELEPVQLKGLSEPVRAWSVVGESEAVGRFEATLARGLTPLVGREAEIDLLCKRWEQANLGEGQVVLLSGEAGVGKSRVLRAFQENIGVTPENRARFYCSPYHTESALYPVINQLQNRLRFSRDDDFKQKLDKLDAALTAFGLPVVDLAPVLAKLLSIPDYDRYPSEQWAPGERMNRTLDALLVMSDTMAAQAPVLMVVEDAHWVDPLTSEFLNHLIDRIVDRRILLVITHRLEFDPPWAGRGPVTLITLNRLGRTESAALASKVADDKAFPEEVLSQIVAKADGIPLFVEELTKMIIESDFLEDAGERYDLTGPLGSLAVPDSLQDSLMARLDRLASVKQVAQMASAIGRNFTLELLTAVLTINEVELEEALSKLVEGQILYRRGFPPHVSYEFKHVLVQDAAYASLLKSQHQQVHRRIAQTLETQFRDTVESDPALLAHHYTQAGLANEAVSYWLKAGGLVSNEERGEALMSIEQVQNVVREVPTLNEIDTQSARLVLERCEHYLKVTNAHDLEATLACFHPEAVMVGVDDTCYEGIEAIRDVYLDLWRDSPDLHCDMTRLRFGSDDIGVFGHIMTGTACPHTHDIDHMEYVGDRIKLMRVYRNAWITDGEMQQRPDDAREGT